MEIVVIAAVADNGVIGRDGGMPWHYPEDMRHFKETTMGHPVVMGRVTYEGIVEDLGGPLPGRTTVVLTTRDLDLPEGAVAADSVDAALEAARTALDERDDEQDAAHVADGEQDHLVDDEHDAVYVAGGATVYEQFLPMADRMVLTEIHDEPAGDTYFPDVDWSEWTAVDRDDSDALSFVVYDRRE